MILFVRSLGEHARHHPVAVFFVLTCLLAWPAWLVQPRFAVESLPWVATWVFGGLSPFLSAIVVARLTGTLGELRDSVTRWRIGRLGAVMTVIVPITAVAAVVLLGSAFAGQFPRAEWFGPLTTLLVLLPIMIVLGGLEEPGWRGFALPRLTDRYGPLGATLVVGVVWGIWHAPLFLVPGTSQYGDSFVGFLVGIVPMSVLMSFVYFTAKRSALAAVVAHALFNGVASWSIAASNAELTLSPLQDALVQPVALGALALVLLLATRGRLGADPVEESTNQSERKPADPVA